MASSRYLMIMTYMSSVKTALIPHKMVLSQKGSKLLLVESLFASG
jgi:hypothetical protein